MRLNKTRQNNNQSSKSYYNQANSIQSKDEKAGMMGTPMKQKSHQQAQNEAQIMNKSMINRLHGIPLEQINSKMLDSSLFKTIQSFLKSDRLMETRESLLNRYNDGHFLTERELRFITMTSESMNKLMDKQWFQNAVDLIDADWLFELEFKVVKNILNEFQKVKNKLCAERLKYMKRRLVNGRKRLKDVKLTFGHNPKNYKEGRIIKFDRKRLVKKHGEKVVWTDGHYSKYSQYIDTTEVIKSLNKAINAREKSPRGDKKNNKKKQVKSKGGPPGVKKSDRSSDLMRMLQNGETLEGGEIDDVFQTEEEQKLEELRKEEIRKRREKQNHLKRLKKFKVQHFMNRLNKSVDGAKIQHSKLLGDGTQSELRQIKHPYSTIFLAPADPNAAFIKAFTTLAISRSTQEVQKKITTKLRRYVGTRTPLNLGGSLLKRVPRSVELRQFDKEVMHHEVKISTIEARKKAFDPKTKHMSVRSYSCGPLLGGILKRTFSLKQRAAITIQAFYRMVLARRRVWKLRNELKARKKAKKNIDKLKSNLKMENILNKVAGLNPKAKAKKERQKSSKKGGKGGLRTPASVIGSRFSYGSIRGTLPKLTLPYWVGMYPPVESGFKDSMNTAMKTRSKATFFSPRKAIFNQNQTYGGYLETLDEEGNPFETPTRKTRKSVQPRQIKIRNVVRAKDGKGHRRRSRQQL